MSLISVQLIGIKNEVIWESKSDNTGKAELWGAIEGSGAEIKHIIIDYHSKTCNWQRSISNHS